jgi:DNA repair protein RadC
MGSGIDEDGDEKHGQHTPIRDWPSEERPREKLLRHGSHLLSDAELLAILLRSGNGVSTAVDVARGILSRHRSLRVVAALSPQELMRVRGIGMAKAVELTAAFEIGRRVEASPDETRLYIRSPEDVAELLVPQLRDLHNEVFVVLHLDAKNGLKHQQRLSVGTLNASLVHPREVYKSAIDHLAASIIVVHNHPSGNHEPSNEDIEITRQLVEAGKIVGIPLHDHIIIAGRRYTSLAERGVL